MTDLAPITPHDLTAILVFGGFITQDQADGFDASQTPEKIKYMAWILNEKVRSTSEGSLP